MPKRVRLVDDEDITVQEDEDPDGLQAQDESDFEWVAAWKTAVKVKLD